MKQINIKFSETNSQDIKVYERIKQASSVTDYIRNLVLWDIYSDEKIKELQKRLEVEHGTKD